MKIAFAVILLFGTFIAPPAHAQVFGPDTFEACLLKHLPGTEGDWAASMITTICRDWFPAQGGSRPTGPGEEEWRRCALKHLPGTRSDKAAQMIVRACIDTYRPGGKP